MVLAFSAVSGYKVKGGPAGFRLPYMLSPVLHKLKRHKGLLFAAAMALTLGWAAVNGSQGIDGMLEKRAQIKKLQEENAALELENARRQERVHRLENNSSDQDLEIRRLNMLKQGETTFMLPESEKPKPDAKPSR